MAADEITFDFRSSPRRRGSNSSNPRRDRLVDYYRLGARDPRLIVDPDWHTGTANGSIPLVREQEEVLSVITRTSTPRPLARTTCASLGRAVRRFAGGSVRASGQGGVR